LREAGKAYTLHVIVLEEECLNQPFREHSAALPSDGGYEYFYQIALILHHESGMLSSKKYYNNFYAF
jgi:hypothetical protein